MNTIIFSSSDMDKALQESRDPHVDFDAFFRHCVGADVNGLTEIFYPSLCGAETDESHKVTLGIPFDACPLCIAMLREMRTQ